MFAFCILSIKNYWVNGFGVLPRKKMPFGEELLLPSMVLCGVAGPQGVCLWKHIQRGRNQFSGSICFELGLGTNVQFWHDRRCRDRDLKDMFPQLYTFAQRKDAAVADLVSWRVDQNVWDVSFYRAMHDWEQGVMSNDQFPFSHLLYKVSPGRR